MPMYTSEPFEARYAMEDNREDIAAWIGTDPDNIIIGKYYEQNGFSHFAEDFNDQFIEYIENEASPTP